MHSASSVLPPMSHFRRNSNTRKMRFLPRAGGSRSTSRSRERDDRDAVEVREADVGQRGADLHRVVQLRQRRADRHRVASSRPGCRCGGPLPPRTGAAAACRGGRRGSSRCSGSRRRARTCGDRRTRCPSRPCACGARRAGFPAKTLRDTMCRCSSVFRNRSSNSSERSLRGLAAVAGSVRLGAASSGHYGFLRRLEDLGDDRVGLDAFGFTLEVEDQAVAQRRRARRGGCRRSRPRSGPRAARGSSRRG